MDETADKKRSAEGRLGAPAAAELLDFYERPHLEREKLQFASFLKVDLAHTAMLAECGILNREQARAILSALRQIEKDGVNGLHIDAVHGSLLFQIEKNLSDRVGEDIGGRMHIGRSRLDQGPTARRLYKRARLFEVFEALIECRAAILDLAAQHLTTVMPGYTCLQHAHPGIFGHYLLSFSSKLGDDFDRMTECYPRLNRNPLGGAGLSGTSWPIDRQRTTQLLGFDALVDNAKLVREAYYAAELTGALSFVMATLNDLATDLHLWSSYEFRMVETADQFCGTSSIFPQKKNPSALEAIKFSGGEAVTWLSSVLATFRAEGTGDVVMREVPLLDKAFPTASGSLSLMAALLGSIRIDVDRMSMLAGATWSTATSLADEIVRRCNRSFREAHHIVARLVRVALTQGLSPKDVTDRHLEEAAAELGFAPLRLETAVIRKALDVSDFAASQKSQGGIGRAEVERLLAAERALLAKNREWLAMHRAQVTQADQTLQRAVDDLLNA